MTSASTVLLPGIRSRDRRSAWLTLFMLVALTTLAIGIHGYHLGAEDAAIYVPAVKKVADPVLYPFGAEFFQTYTDLSLCSRIVGYTARWSGLSGDMTIFFWHIACVFLLFVGAYRLVSVCFTREPARWAGMMTLAALLTCPVAGTALILMEPYLTARSLSTPLLLFAAAELLGNRRVRAFAWLAVTLLVHLQMAFYGIVFAGIYLFSLSRARLTRTSLNRIREIEPRWAAGGLLAALPVAFNLQPAHGVYRDILQSRSYFLVSNWSWAEWLGVVGPLAVLWWFSRSVRRNVTPVFPAACQALVWMGLLFTVGAIVLAIPPQLQTLARLQPMRAFHLIYVCFFLFAGAAIGEYLLKRAAWRWLALFVPMMLAMLTVQLLIFPASSHFEFPLMRSHNPWVSAFLWIRTNTPKDAVFAIDPDYFGLPEEDMHGFRAIAERSTIADNLKDSGPVSIFPQLADDWKEQVDSLHGWGQFRLANFRRLHERYGVTWIVWQGARPEGFTCPFGNNVVQVCQMVNATDKSFPLLTQR